jgi:competence protein ComFB
MDLKNRYDFSILVNETEHMVIDELERALDDAVEKNICTCEDCVLDMAALALNILKPHYRVSLLGAMYAHGAIDPKYYEEVTRAVNAAIEKVRRNPAHD